MKPRYTDHRGGLPTAADATKPGYLAARMRRYAQQQRRLEQEPAKVSPIKRRQA